MAKMYYEKDCELSYLNGKKIAIIGYGSQGHAHALNLKDSGCDVCVGLRAGSKNWAEAEKAGLAVKTVAEAAAWGGGQSSTRSSSISSPSARPVGEKRRVWYKWQAAAFSGLTVSRTRLEAPKGLERI